MHNLPVCVRVCGQVAQPLISATIMAAQVSTSVWSSTPIAVIPSIASSREDIRAPSPTTATALALSGERRPPACSPVYR